MLKKMWSLAAALVLSFGITTAAQADNNPNVVEIGWAAWADAEFVTKVAAQILEERMGQEVELTQTSIAPQYQGLASGDIDAMMMAWLPATHAAYWDRIAKDVVNFGPIYSHAKLGWVIPDYIPKSKLNSIADLKNPAVREKLDATITGIDPGAGLTDMSKKTIQKYNLDYNLLISSGAAMTAALDRAISNHEWIVVTGWSPHWMFGAYDLRYLKDPKGALGGYERIHVLLRQGFYQDNIEAAGLFARFWMPIGQLQKYMFKASQNSYAQAVDAFIKENPARVHYWVTGEIK